MIQFDYKVKNGKLLRILVDIDSGKIRSLKIRGDFFMHPEDFIYDLESFLVGKSVLDLDLKTLDEYLHQNKVEIIGFSSSDLLYCLNQINDNL